MSAFDSSSIRTRDQRPRVFISSTLDELSDERQAAKLAIQDLKLHPVMFESGATPYPPRDWYTAALGQSHIYVGIFGTSYGQIVPGMDISGLEDEFNLATDMPRLVYVQNTSDARDARLNQLLQRIRDAAKVVYCRFSDTDDLLELIKDDVVQLLSEAYFLNDGLISSATGFTHLANLQKEMESKVLLNRDDLLVEIRVALESQGRLLLVGDPGIGKTYLLGSLASNLDAMYVPLRHKSTQQVCSYLANQLAAIRGKLPRRLLTEDEARAGLQEELDNGTRSIFFDEADQNPVTLEALLGLEFRDIRVIFASRGPRPQFLEQLARFDVPGLTDEEFDGYLELNGIALPPGERQTLADASRGNPLYLFYYTQHPLSPPPDGLVLYERALWTKLSASQRELLNLVALSFAPLTMFNLHEILADITGKHTTPMETKELIDSSAPLIRPGDHILEIFHPHFEEFVREELEHADLTAHYHRILGEYAIRQRWIVSTAYHFLRAGDQRARPYIPQAATGAYMRGNWSLAEELLTVQIQQALEDDDSRAEASARYTLASLYQEMGRREAAREQIDHAVELLASLEADQSDEQNEELTDALTVLAILVRAEESESEDAVEGIRVLAQKYEGKDPYIEAGINADLAYICIRQARYREGTAAAQRALDLFTELDDERGIYVSLTNLSACVGELGDDELREQYARRLVDFGVANALPRAEAAGLNHLAIVQRHKSDYLGAESTLRRAIDIGRRLGSRDLEVSNIANLGNVFKDRHLPDRADAAYREAIAKAQEYGLIREEAFGLELLARLKYEVGLYEDAVALGEHAYELHKPLANSLRIATTLDYLARSYAKLQRGREAAETYETSALKYELAEMWTDAAQMFQRSAGLWSSLKDAEHAFHCTSQAVRCAVADENPTLASRLLPGTASWRGAKLGQLYLDALKPLLQSKSAPSLNGLLRDIVVYSKGQDDPTERGCSERAVEHIAQQLSPAAPRNLLNGLAATLEQSNSLLTADDLDGLAHRVAQKTPHWHYRVADGGLRVFTLGLKWEQPLIVQVTPLTEQLLPHRIAFSIALILRANADIIETTLSELGGNHERGFSLNVVTQEDIEKQAGVVISSEPNQTEPLPASMIESNVPYGQAQPSTTLVLHDDYLHVSDWAQHPNNKAFVWVLMNVFRVLVTHATHGSQRDHPLMAKRGREFCEAVLL